jgi:hypothetical protein
MFDATPMRSVGSNGPMSTRQVEYHTPETNNIVIANSIDKMTRWSNTKGGGGTPNAALAGKGALEFGSNSVNSGAQFQ